MKNVLVAVAWPYANADIHVGNITGSYLPADIFARYHRLKGNRVLMVSGTDAHGTPITVRADAEKTTAEAMAQRYQQRFTDLFYQTGLSYDLFTSTHTENHFRVSQDFFRTLQAERIPLPRETEGDVFREGKAFPAGPLRGRRVLHLPLPERARRPVRQLRQSSGRHPADQPAQPHRRLRARCRAKPSISFSTSANSRRRSTEFLSTGKESLACQRSAIRPQYGRPGIARPADHPRSGLGHPGSGAGLGETNGCTYGSRR